MIPQSRAIAGICVLLAASSHVGASYVLSGDPEIEIAGAGAPEIAMTGSAFADMVAGVMTSVEPTEITPETPPTETTPPEVTEVTERPDATEAPTPDQTETPTTEVVETPTNVPQEAAEVPTETAEVPETTEVAEPVDAQDTPVPDIVPQEPVSRSTDLAAVVPVPTAPTVTQPLNTTRPVQALQPIQPAQPVTSSPTNAPTETDQVDEPDRIVAEDLNPAAVQRSLRPPVRPEGLAPPPPPRTQTTQQRTQPAQQPRGNSQQNARAGTTSGQQNATSTQSGSNANTSQTSAASNAAISNYPGQVMRKISRVRRPRTNARGAAVVRFSIAGSGGLASASIARSSGNADLDQLALRVVRSAAPFPPPPAGARTSFSVEITGR